MAWIEAASGNVIEVDDLEHIKKAFGELDEDGKPRHKVWETDPRGSDKPKPWKPEPDTKK